MLRLFTVVAAFMTIVHFEAAFASGMCESSLAKRIFLFDDHHPLVDFNLVLPRIAPGQEIVFGSGKSFKVNNLLFVSKQFRAYVVNEGQILLMPNFEGLSPNHPREASLYHFGTRSIQEMAHHQIEIEKSQIDHIAVHHFDTHHQYVLIERLPDDARSLRDILKNTDDLTRQHFEALGDFAQRSAHYESFGNADILDQVYYSPTQGVKLLFWSDVKKIDTKKLRDFPVASVFHQGMQATSVATRFDALKLNKINAYKNDWQSAKQCSKSFQLFSHLLHRTKMVRQTLIHHGEIIVADIEEGLDHHSPQKRMDVEAITEAFAEWDYTQSIAVDHLLAGIGHSDYGSIYIPESFSYVSAFHASQAFLLTPIWQIRIFDEIAMVFFPPSDLKFSDRYHSSAATYWNNYQRITKAGIPILPAVKHKMGIIEPSFKIPFFTAAELLFRLQSLDDPLFRSFVDFAKQSAPIEDMDSLRLVDIVYFPGRGWQLRHADGKIKWHEQGTAKPSDTEIPCLFRDELLDEVILADIDDPSDVDAPNRKLLQDAMQLLRRTVHAQRLGLLD